jgi:hypothetical protein
MNAITSGMVDLNHIKQIRKVVLSFCCRLQTAWWVLPDGNVRKQTAETQDQSF